MKKIFDVSIFLVVALFMFSLAGAEGPPLPPPLPTVTLKNTPIKKVLLEDYGGWSFEIVKYEEKNNSDGIWETEGTRFLNLYFTQGVSLNTPEVAPLHLIVNLWIYGKSEKTCQKWVIKEGDESYYERIVEDKENLILAYEIIYLANDSTLDSFRKTASSLIKEKAEKEGIITERPVEQPLETSPVAATL